ncbi:hypothetical protein LR48_Vigan650s000300 [Vigna angularis]|uniref:Uncharacterized protein n=1 Tax=Phaseolus angularis TaxID=3914 RepID=A0A0L9TFI5_PHAAN|nr:hypothetical protein LR48_Vigan650s000300 [Vigna angularis]
MNLMKEVKWNRDGIRKGHKKCKRRGTTSTAQHQLALSGTLKDPLAPLRGRIDHETIHTRSKKTSEPLLQGLDESRRRRRVRTSRELFTPPKTLLQPSPQGSYHNTEEMVEENNDRWTLATEG